MRLEHLFFFFNLLMICVATDDRPSCVGARCNAMKSTRSAVVSSMQNLAKCDGNVYGNIAMWMGVYIFVRLLRTPAPM